MHENLFQMTERQFDIMLYAIHLGDGAKQGRQNWTRRSCHISTGNVIFADRLQRMAVLRGYRASVSVHQYNKNPIYVVHLKKQSFVRVGSCYDGRPAWAIEPHSNEWCWCVENSLGTIVTRRNGKVAIVGNCQMVGRGTRICDGKENLLLLDFLWHTANHELCHPAHLICESAEVADKATAIFADNPGVELDLEAVESQAESGVVADREEALAKRLEEMRHKKAKLVDPIQYEMSIGAEDLVDYQPAFGWEMAPASDKQIEALEKHGIFPGDIDNAGKASLLLDRLAKRRAEGLASPKQIRLLERNGFQHVGKWGFDEASKMITRIAASGWRVPSSVDPATYQPEPEMAFGFEEVPF